MCALRPVWVRWSDLCLLQHGPRSRLDTGQMEATCRHIEALLLLCPIWRAGQSKASSSCTVGSCLASYHERASTRGKELAPRCSTEMTKVRARAKMSREKVRQSNRPGDEFIFHIVAAFAGSRGYLLESGIIDSSGRTKIQDTRFD